MKNCSTLFLVSLVLAFTSGCSYTPKTPDFINLKNVQVSAVNINKVVLRGDAIFNNPNPVAGTLTKTNIHIKVNEVDITDIEQSTSIEVPKNSEFTVPVTFSFNPKLLSSENEGFFKSALKNFLNKELTVDYAGDVTIEVLGIGFDVPVAYTQQVSLGATSEQPN
jgi:LEA14-like dessication related protein